MPAAENGSLHPEKDMDLAPIINNGMETLPKTKQVSLLLMFNWVFRIDINYNLNP